MWLEVFFPLVPKTTSIWKAVEEQAKRIEDKQAEQQQQQQQQGATAAAEAALPYAMQRLGSTCSALI